ncbi:MAG TPA: DMT family transporter [Aridibacter sp.]|nr:DMT family transporter [Aridibacter sp.]
MIRIASAAAVLSAIILLTRSRDRGGLRGRFTRGNVLSAFFLFGYAICFSFAYLGLTTATGALILFGCVQATMLIYGLAKGERPGALEWIGLAVALGGLVYLVFPGLESPSLISTLLMAAAGIAWGFYTLRGKGSSDPVAQTAGNFILAVPFVLLASVPFVGGFFFTSYGVLWAVLSGAVASGIGYSVWYAALRGHTSSSAAVVQLSVPVIAAAGGLVLLNESLSVRLAIASVLILGGIWLAVKGKSKK